MELIEDHQPHAGQLGIVLQHPGQDPLGDHLQPGIRPHAGFGAHPVTHRLPRLFTQQICQPLRDITGGDPARFEQNNFAVNSPLRQDLQRQPRRFPRTGGRSKQNLGGVL